MDRPISVFNKALISDAYEQEKRTREAITSTEWNNLFNQHRYQGNHSENYLEELDHYLFGYTPADEEPIAGALLSVLEHVDELQESIDMHKEDLENPHQVIAEQINASAITGVSGGQVQAILEDLKTQIDTKMAISSVADIYETKEDAASHIIGVSLNEGTGVFTFTRNNGSTFTIDTAIEKIATNWNFNAETQRLELTLKDGTVQEVDLSVFIRPNEFINSDDIVWSISGSNVSCSITSTYKNTMQSLKTGAESAATRAETAATTATNKATNASSYATAAQTSSSEATSARDTARTYRDSAELYKNAANSYATSASASSVLSESYAKGGTNTRTGEDTDNSKYYMERAAYWATQAASGQLQSDWSQTDTLARDYIKNKPTIPTVDQTYSATSENAISSKGLKPKFETLANNFATVQADLGNVNSLTTTSKTAVGAINELNANKLDSINGITGPDAVIDAGDITLDGYTESSSADNVLATDTINEAIGKVEKKADVNASDIHDIDHELIQIPVEFDATDWVASSANPDYPYEQTLVVPQLIDGAEYRGAIEPYDGSAFLDEDEQFIYVNLLRDDASITAYASEHPTHTITMWLGRL